MSVISMKQLLEAGVHFGHQTRRWNPKMAKYIFTERNGIYIIDLQKTVRKAEEAYMFIRDVAAQGGSVLFVGTKKQARESIEQEAKRCNMFYVNNRWLGGMLTNFKTIRQSIARLTRINNMEKNGDFEALTKKEVSKLVLEREKLEKNLGGIKEMRQLPSALFIVDPRKEHIAISEARKLGIPIVGICDTNCDPDELDYVIPGNDDAIRAVKLIAGKMADAVIEGRQGEQEEEQVEAEANADAQAVEESAELFAEAKEEPVQASDKTRRSISMAVSASDVKALREATGAGMMDCKKALTEADGNMEKATEILREKGLAAAAKKSGRIAAEGVVASYIHMGGRIGVLVEVNCETDFVAKTDQFQSFVRDIAMQIAASNPLYLSSEEVPQDTIDKEKEILRIQAINEGKPEKIVNNMVEGRIKKYFKEVCLLDQPFVKDSDKSIADYVKEQIAALGENITIRRFTRYEMGEGLQKREDNFVEEVMNQAKA